MKNGKHPTLAQKKFMKSHGLDPEDHLVVSKTALKKEKMQGIKARTRKLYRQE